MDREGEREREGEGITLANKASCCRLISSGSTFYKEWASKTINSECADSVKRSRKRRQSKRLRLLNNENNNKNKKNNNYNNNNNNKYNNN